jgi:anaerobic magnesium-protoporphyrin IX monomethyl ester cyclase
MAELEMLISRYGVKSVMFHDDQFILGNGAWVREFIKALHDAGMVRNGLRWVTSSRADIICRHDSLIGEMARAGLEMLIVGFESFSPRVLKWFNKGVTSEENHRAAEILHKHGVKIWANYILGVRTDTGYHKEDDFMTVEGVLRAKPVHFSPATYTPIPGSILYKYYKDNGLILLDEEAEKLGDRGARVPKVKGVDYEFVNAVMIDDSIFI